MKCDEAVAKLVKDRDALLTVYDFPAEHWKHICTANPIESGGARVKADAIASRAPTPTDPATAWNLPSGAECQVDAERPAHAISLEAGQGFHPFAP
jgi:hypothetical protein